MTLEELYEIIGGNYPDAIKRLRDSELIRDFLAQFLRDRTYARFAEALEHGENTFIFKYAHELGGISSTLGLSDLQECAAEVEAAVISGDLTEIMRTSELLEGCYTRSCKEINLFLAQ